MNEISFDLRWGTTFRQWDPPHWQQEEQQHLGQDLNSEPTKYKAGVLTSSMWYSVTTSIKNFKSDLKV